MCGPGVRTLGLDFSGTHHLPSPPSVLDTDDVTVTPLMPPAPFTQGSPTDQENAQFGWTIVALNQPP